MSRKLLLGAVLAGLVVFLWSGISHMLLPWWNTTLKGFSNEEAIGAAIVQGGNEDGIYLLPRYEPGDEAGEQRMAAGPVTFVALTGGGRDPSSAGSLILQLIFDIIIALLMARLFICVGPQAFSVRLRMVVVIAVIAGLMAHLPNWAWFGFAGVFTFLSMLDLIIGWTLGGLVLTRFAK